MNIRIEEHDGKKTYYVNDVPYSRLEDIPEEHKHHFADSDNNGMPDQFDSLIKLARGKAGFKDVLKTLAKEITSNDQGEEPTPTPEPTSRPASIPEKGRYLREERSGSSGLPFYIKVLIFVLVGLSAALFIVSRLPDSSETPVVDEASEVVRPVEEAAIEVVPEPEAVEEAASQDEFKFVIEDPNEPPYKMFVNVFQGNTLLFAFDLPPGKLVDTGTERLAIGLEIPQGTNLSSALFEANILAYQCPPDDMDWALKSVGATEYKTTLVSDSGAGHTYNTYYYVLSGAYCAQFSLTFTSVNAGILESDVKEYSPDDLIALVEDALRTARFE